LGRPFQRKTKKDRMVQAMFRNSSESTGLRNNWLERAMRRGMRDKVGKGS
jgi:hypothetical protein